MGRDDNDLITAVNGIARGQVIFRGDTVTINDVNLLAPREPYDAPKWVQLNKPIYFNTLQDYQGQFAISWTRACTHHTQYDLTS
ncbi:cellulose synthase regulator protein [Proteus mirabilis]|uniref:Cyclic di-GMP-binding protein n=1 Tax=Proteus mirabilis TaxID=584 RepID=A0A2X2BFJ7_PROMI|nr:cellulose synthase regulator protein [Proteus mirabilis]